jgi:hypothetical protein
MGRCTDLPIKPVMTCGDIALTTSTEVVAGVPHVMNFSVSLKDTEYSVALPLGTKRFSLNSRGTSTLKVNINDHLSSAYKLVPSGAFYGEEGIDSSNAYTLYLSSSQDSDIVEITYWT